MLFLETVRQSIVRHDLLLPDTTVLLAVSGGADSLALMLALKQLQQTFAVNLHIVTVDHGWRGAASVADADFVTKLARSLDIPVTNHKLALDDMASNLEAVSRQARYTYFGQLARDIGADRVAVGHHADDQAETIFMRLLRGTGLEGLRGMRWQSPMPYAHDITLIRPLLGVTRAEIEAFCNENGVTPRVDATNSDTSYLRNHIRLELMPQLHEINPHFSAGLVRLGDVVSIEDNFIAQETARIIQESAVRSGNRWKFPRKLFRSLHSALQRRVIRELAGRLQLENDEITYEHITAAQQLCLNGDQGAISEFSGHVQVRIDYEALIFERHSDENNSFGELMIVMQAGESIEFSMNQWVNLPGGSLMLTENPVEEVTQLGEIYLPMNETPRLRTRRAGDRIALPGLNGRRQKVSDWMINRKIPLAQRDSIPLMIVENQIVAILHDRFGIVAHPFHLPENNSVRYFIIWALGK